MKLHYYRIQYTNYFLVRYTTLHHPIKKKEKKERKELQQILFECRTKQL